MANYAEMKVAETQNHETSGTRARAKLHGHLAQHGWWLEESDAAGPLVVWVKGGDSVQRWRRDGKDDKGRDFWMSLEETRKVSYE